MMNTVPIEIVPWDTPFLPVVQRRIVEVTQGQPGRAVVLMPHKRPKRYLTECFRHDASLPRPVLLPRMLSVGELIALWRTHADTSAGTSAGILDQVFLLHQAVRDTADNNDVDLSHRFSAMTMARFMPWGLRLSALFEECFSQGVDAHDIPHIETTPFAAELLGALGRIQARYRDLLREGDWTTPGLDARIAAHAAHGDAPIPLPLRPQPERPVCIIGFGSLTWAEDALLQRLWREGAYVFLHSDPSLANPKAVPHFACADHARWLREWRAPCQLSCPPTGNTPDIQFFAGYDVHSQLAVVEDTVRDTTLSTALVIPNPSLLIPVLHHMPDAPFNVSMGYPLEHAPVCRLVEAVLRMHESASITTDTPEQPLHFHWRAVRHCLQHPCLLALHVPDTKLVLRDALMSMERHLRAGSRFADPYALAQAAEAEMDVSLRDLLHTVLAAVVDTVAQARTLYDMGNAIRGLCELLLEYSASAIERSPLDAESLYRIMRHVVPELTGSALAHDVLPQAALFAITRELLQAQRVPFEADPLTGIQVLGMLETRLLHFERIIVVDATDDVLPGFSTQDPLVPDALRGILGLPDTHSRERTAAYTFFRLLAGATQARILWQENVPRSALFDGKKVRSRFVDHCLWAMEQERKALIMPGTPPLYVADCPVVPPRRERQGVVQSDALRAALHSRLQRGLSATLLDAYLRCPARFAWEYILRLTPAKEVNEGDDPAAVGALLHKVLHHVYTPWLGKHVRQGDISARYVQECFATALADSSLNSHLPPDSRLMLEVSAPLRLARYLDAQPETTYIHALEQRMEAPLPPDNPYMLYGVIDRIDKRENGLMVLDYKTGKVCVPKVSVWEDTTLATHTDSLSELAQAMPSVQLPVYMYLCQHTNTSAYDAALIRLREDGVETPLLGDSVDDTLRAVIIQERIPRLLSFLVTHMTQTPYYAPHEGAHCQWCPYVHICENTP